MITVIVFDFAGVLGLRLTPLFAALLHRELGIPEEQAIRAWETNNQPLDRGTLPEKEFWERFRRDLSIPLDYPAEARFLTCVEPEPEMVALARRLKGNGYTIGILSNIAPSGGEKIKRMREFHDIIDVRVLSYEIGEVKPEPVKTVYAPEELRIYTMFEQRLREHGVSFQTRQSILFIDDKDGPCASARQHGWTAVKYAYDMDKLLQELRTHGVRV